jgi:hypothetical protein
LWLTKAFQGTHCEIGQGSLGVERHCKWKNKNWRGKTMRVMHKSDTTHMDYLLGTWNRSTKTRIMVCFWDRARVGWYDGNSKIKSAEWTPHQLWVMKVYNICTGSGLQSSLWQIKDAVAANICTADFLLRLRFALGSGYISGYYPMSLHVNDPRIDMLRCADEYLITGDYHINFIEFTYVPTICNPSTQGVELKININRRQENALSSPRPRCPKSHLQIADQ